MKRIGIFGREVSVLVIVGIVLAVSATAALVGYLSNSITGSVTVESPMQLYFNDDDSSDTAEDFGSVKGGAELLYKTHAVNLGSDAVDVHNVVHVITSDSVWQGEEFEHVFLCDPRYYTCAGAQGEGIDILDDLYHVKGNGDLVKFTDVQTVGTTTVKLLYAPGGTAAKYSHESGADIVNFINVGVAPNYVGTMSMKLCHLYELTGTCP